MPSIHPAALERGAQTAGADSLDPAARPPPVLGVRALLRAQGLWGRRTPGLLGMQLRLGWGWGKDGGGDPGMGWAGWGPGSAASE